MPGGVITLGRVAARLTMVDIWCNRYPRKGRVSTARLVTEHGADFPIPDLLSVLAADCPKMLAGKIYDRCGVHLPQLPGLFR